jgi:hypothetical protein
VAPLPGQLTVVRAFLPPSQRWSAGHRGVDLRGAAGAVVRTAGSGRVAFAGPLAGRGVVAVAHDDGTRTTYEPVAATVAVGERLRAGDPIGTLIGAGSHCLPAACLHWGRIAGRTYLDPMALLRRAPVRLLPVWAGGSLGAASRSAPVPTSPARPAGSGATQSGGTRTGQPLGRGLLGVVGSGVAALALGRRLLRGPSPHSSDGSAAASRA